MEENISQPEKEFSPSPSQTIPNSKSKLSLILVGILLLALGGVGGFLLGRQSLQPKSTTTAQVTPLPSETPVAERVTETPSATPNPTAEWKTYHNDEYGFEIKYPAEWLVREGDSLLKEGNHVFKEGDLFSAIIIGETQRQNTELYDGAQIIIGMPIRTEEDINSWVKNYYPIENINGEPNYFSEETIGNLVFQKVYTCGLGCFTYYNLKNNDLVFRLLTSAEGPKKEIYQQTLQTILSTFKFLD